MQVQVWDQGHGTQLAVFPPGTVEGIKYSIESPYGMMDASFSLPIAFDSIQPWADYFNQVELYDAEGRMAWSGFIYGLGRNFKGESIRLTVECVGWVAKLGMLRTTSDLSAEKGSTFITDHVLGNPQLMQWLTAGEIATNDFTFTSTLDHSGRPTLRECMDELLKYNQFDWQVKHKKLYWKPDPINDEYGYSTTDYYTHIRYIEGSLKRDLGNFANLVRFKYGANYSATGVTGDYPRTETYEDFGDVTVQEAAMAAVIKRNEMARIRSSSPVTVSRIWDSRGTEVPLTRAEAGKVIRLGNVSPSPTALSEAYTPNDADTFKISKLEYDNDKKVVKLSPGKVASSLPVILARMGLNNS